MAHNIMENDEMFSVRKTPWHGLGRVLNDYPSIEDAIQASGLDWTATLQDMFLQDGAQITGRKAVVRSDTGGVLGVVGTRYEIHQNAEMWDFISALQQEFEFKLETAGSLRNGATTWVLASDGEWEAVDGDPIREHFLFTNSFDGCSPVMAMFTNVRVVCNNTLSAALSGARNKYRVRHLAGVKARVEDARAALGIRSRYQVKFRQGLASLVDFQMSEKVMRQYLAEDLFVSKAMLKLEEGIEVPDSFLPPEAKDILNSRANEKAIDRIMQLVDSGAGADIPGVRGTAYGLYNAVAEYADHEKQIRVSQGRERGEVRFESALMGRGAGLKEQAFTGLLNMAAM